MKRTNQQITDALAAVNGDLERAASALNVTVQWLRITALRRGLI